MSLPRDRSEKFAWLAGVLDVGGSISVSSSGIGGPPRAVVQFVTKSDRIMRQVVKLLAELGCNACYDTSNKGSKSYRVRVYKAPDQALLADELAKYAVGKKKHWELLATFAKLRLRGVETSEDGKLSRGGAAQWFRAFADEEIAVLRQMREMNQ